MRYTRIMHLYTVVIEIKCRRRIIQTKSTVIYFNVPLITDF